MKYSRCKYNKLYNNRKTHNITSVILVVVVKWRSAPEIKFGTVLKEFPSRPVSVCQAAKVVLKIPGAVGTPEVDANEPVTPTADPVPLTNKSLKLQVRF